MGIARREFDPVGNYAFSVELDGITAAQFSAVDGLSYECELIEYRVSEAPNLPRFRPGTAGFGSVTLKGGVIDSTELVDWIARCQAGIYERKDITINVYDNAGHGVVGWNLFRCLPSKWSITSLDGKGNDVSFRSIELRVEEARRVGAPGPARGNEPRVVVTRESSSGKNLDFKDTETGREMSKDEFVDAIEAGEYEDYHVRNVGGDKIPASNPNQTTSDNLG